MPNRTKGQGYEREFCKQLSAWWSRVGDDDLFWRTHGSGARATTRTKLGKRTKGQYGDVCAVDHRGRSMIDFAVISLKRGYAAVTISDLMDYAESNKHPSSFSTWIREAVRDHHQSESLGWLLIIRRNSRKALIFMPLHLKMALYKAGCKGLDKCVPQAQCTWDITHKKEHFTDLRKYIHRHAEIWGTTLDNFLMEVDRKNIVELAKKHKAYLKEQAVKDKIAAKYKKVRKHEREEVRTTSSRSRKRKKRHR